MDDLWRCAHCHDVIGVYEPLVMVEGAGTRTSGRLQEPPEPAAGAAPYHAGCHELAAVPVSLPSAA
jgi:hypothetical protein